MKTFVSSASMKCAFLLLFILSSSASVSAATITSKTITGDWNDPYSWQNGAVPGVNDDVIIVSGAVITVKNNASVKSFNINYGGILNIGVSNTISGTLTYSDNSSIEEGGHLNVNSTGVLQTTNISTAILTVNGGNSVSPALTVTGLMRAYDWTLGGNKNTDEYTKVSGEVLVNHNFNMVKDGNSQTILILDGLLIVKNVFDTSNSGGSGNIQTSGNGNFSVQGREGNGNPANTVVGAGVPALLNYCVAANPCKPTPPKGSDCEKVCNAVNNSQLPITLVSFDATYQPHNNRIKLEWTTASEINNDYFTIERSADARNFQVIQTMKGAGNSRERLAYTTYDENPLPGLSYYRLKQTDFDGQLTYSKLSSVENGETTEFGFQVTPNPFNGRKLTLLLTDESPSELRVTVYNGLGRAVYEGNYTADNGNKLHLTLSQSLPGGVYWVRVNAGGQVAARKIIVVNQ